MSKKQDLDDSMRDGHPLPQKAPFPYFGGKSKVASLVWERLGNVDNYVEPFGGSLAVLLARPHEHKWWEKKESAGDYAGHVVNFYRSVLHDPTAVAKFATKLWWRYRPLGARTTKETMDRRSAARLPKISMAGSCRQDATALAR